MDHDCDTLADVQAAFGDTAANIEWLTFQNDPALREVVSFVPMLERVANLDPNEMTFVCHAKGATHGHDDSVCHCWLDVMAAACLDSPELIECALEDAAICGAFRTRSGHLNVPWHFSGTFYWLRHDRAFARNWRNIHRHYCGTESWPGLQFGWEESKCLFLDHPQSLYDEHYWYNTVFPSYRHWQANLRSCGLTTTRVSAPEWLTRRVVPSPIPNGRDGFATTPLANGKLRRIAKSLHRALPSFRR
jgi:hypothetical protein